MPERTLQDQVDRYACIWNEPDAKRRRQELKTLYTESACLVTRSSTSTGLEEVVEHIGSVHDRFIGSGRYRFRSAGFLGHHDCVLFRWEMVDADSGELADAGMNLFLFSLDGRIEGDYQFPSGVDSSLGSNAGYQS